MDATEILGSAPGFTAVDLGAGVIAGFTNRYYGVSSKPYDSLNLGPNVNDAPAAVASNRSRVKDLVGAPIVFSTQVHGADVIELDDASLLPWLEVDPPISIGPADALISRYPQVGLGVLVADCVPILLAGTLSAAAPRAKSAYPVGHPLRNQVTADQLVTDPVESGVRVVATAHAGRRGIELNVIRAVVEQMRQLGATSIVAAIGPAVCGRCYEVPAQMRDEVAAQEPKAWAVTRLGTAGLDLPAAAADQLQRTGVEVVYQSPVCTFEDSDYFSHRRATGAVAGGGPGVTGRQAGIIRLLPPQITTV